ncbi:MAG: GNAT family N-acetyltransferase [Bdellovibrionota bacterium]
MRNIKIRKTKLEDIDAVMRVHSSSIRDLCSNDYSEDQIQLWSAVNYDEGIWQNSVLREHHLVLEVDGEIMGFCHSCVQLDGTGEIRELYLSKQIAGKGYGREIIEQSLDYLKNESCKKILINSTITAKAFYEKIGFQCEREKTVKVRNTELLTYSMLLKL